MAFINIFNFKKYFTKPSDAQVARYGHVNALYDALNTGSSTINVPTPVTFSNMNFPNINYYLQPSSYDFTKPQKFLFKATYDGIATTWNPTGILGFIKFTITDYMEDHSAFYINYSLNINAPNTPTDFSSQRWTTYSICLSNEINIYIRPAAITNGPTPAIDTSIDILPGTIYTIALEIIPVA